MPAIKPAPDPAGGDVWYVYLIRCREGQLYTGISTDVQRRFEEHRTDKGAKYLRGKAPLQLVFQQAVGSRSEALRAEAAIKRLPRGAKEAIIRGESDSSLP